MNRGEFERQLSRIGDALQGLRSNWLDLHINFATKEEAKRLLELLDKQVEIKGATMAKAAPEGMAEIVALYESWCKRRKTRLGQE